MNYYPQEFGKKANKYSWIISDSLLDPTFIYFRVIFTLTKYKSHGKEFFPNTHHCPSVQFAVL